MTTAFTVIDSSSPITSPARLRRHVSDCVGEPGTRYRKAWDSSVLLLSSIGATIEIGDPGADYQNGEVEVLLHLGQRLQLRGDGPSGHRALLCAFCSASGLLSAYS